MESFNARLRDELLNVEVFTCLDEAQVLADDWRSDYNANHPHSALGMMSPARFAAQLAANRQYERPNQPRTLTRGGPMNGVRSIPRSAGRTLKRGGPISGGRATGAYRRLKHADGVLFGG